MMYKVDAMFDSFSKAATALRVSVLFLALLCAQGFPSAAPAWAEPESGLTLDFKDADIHALIKYISEATGRNFITDPTVKGKVTVYSPVKISPDEAFETFVSILRVQGYAVQKSGTAYKIVPLKEGLGQGEDAAVGRKMGSELETVVTQIVPLKVGVAAELAKILPSLLGKDYAISAYTPSNTLALTAPAPNVAKAMAFLEQVEASDTAGTSATLGLQYGDSKTLAATLAKILKSRDEEYAKKGRPTVSLVLADERTNSLLIYGDPEAIGMARDAVGSLDIPTPKGKATYTSFRCPTPRPRIWRRSSTRSWSASAPPERKIRSRIPCSPRTSRWWPTSPPTASWSPPARTNSKPSATSSPSSTWCASRCSSKP